MILFNMPFKKIHHFSVFPFISQLPVNSRSIKSFSFKYDNIYSELKYFLSNNPLNNATQIKLEKFLLENCIVNENDINGVDRGLYSKKTSKFLLQFKPDLQRKISNFIKFKSEYQDDKSLKAQHKLILVDIIETVKPSYIITILLGRFLKILTNSKHNHTAEKNTALEIAIDISKDLIRQYLSVLYKKSLVESDESTKSTFSDWKEMNSSLVDKLGDGVLRANIGVLMIEWLEDCNLISKKLVRIKTNQVNIYHTPENLISEWDETLLNEMWEPSDSSSVLLGNNLITSPIRLPCIVRPKLYLNSGGKIRLGGYLLNDVEYTDPLILPNHSLGKQSIILKDNIIYDMVNKLNSVGYKINSDILNFIMMNQELFQNELEPEDHPLDEKKKLTSRERVLYQKHIGKLQLQQHILNIANLFVNIPEFFFVNRIDNRGRLYCVTEYLNYQSTDLAKSLLLFSVPNKIRKFGDEISINYLKVYGCNCYGNKIAKQSVNDKVEWVNLNTDRILNYENGDIIKEAANKLLFATFCNEYKKWWEFYHHSTDSFFNSHLPLQLDASCNGFQHLVLLSGETNLRKELNLTSSDHSQKPYDFYSYILEIYKDHLNSLDLSSFDDEIKKSYERIMSFCLDRAIVKKVIMTIPYNASNRKMVDYISELLTKEYVKKGDEASVWLTHPEDVNDPKRRLSYKDLNLLVSSLRDVLDTIAPRVTKLKEYLKKMAVICYELKIHIPWLLPIGLHVRQSYLEEKSVLIKPFSYSNTKIKLSSYTKNFNLNKQRRAFMPNLIHSLDATSMMLLLKEYFYNPEFSVKNIYTIHDCFGMSMNHVEFIIDNLRKVYISLYSESAYLKQLDKGIFNQIAYHYREVSLTEDNKLIIIQDNEKRIFDYPDIKEVIGRELPSIPAEVPYILV